MCYCALALGHACDAVPALSITSGRWRAQLLRRTVKRFRGGLVFKANRLLCHSTLGSRVIKKKESALVPRLVPVLLGAGSKFGQCAAGVRFE
jgi:hypothetical protein